MHTKGKLLYAKALTAKCDDLLSIHLDPVAGLTQRNMSIEMRQRPLEFSEVTDGIRWCSRVG